MFFPMAMFYLLVVVLYVLMYVYCSRYWTLSLMTNVILCTVVLFVLLNVVWNTYLSTTYLVRRHQDSLPTIPSASHVYHTLIHGDVLFFKDYYPYMSKYRCSSVLVYPYFNYGIYHAGVIVEEQGKKYIIHAYATKKIDPRMKKLQSYKNRVHNFISGWQWHVVKESLLEYVLSCKSIFHVYRHPSPPKKIQWKRNYDLTFCCHVVARLLQDNGMIPESKQWFIPYFTTDEIIETLTNNGFKLFRFKQI